METKIEMRVLTVISGLLIAASTIQMATAAARNAQKGSALACFRNSAPSRCFRFGGLDFNSAIGLFKLQ
jgi:hypothetical protein